MNVVVIVKKKNSGYFNEIEIHVNNGNTKKYCSISMFYAQHWMHVHEK